MNRRPDYIGAWDCTNYAGLIEHFGYTEPKRRKGNNTFQLFIELRNRNRFEGRTLDDAFGEARVSGFEDDGTICFSKEYSPESKQKGASKDTLYYKGIKFIGRPHPEEEESELVVGAIRGKDIATQVFVMRKWKRNAN